MDEVEHEMAGLEVMRISEGQVELIGDGGCGVGREEFLENNTLRVEGATEEMGMR
jgi:hypothetical protein